MKKLLLVAVALFCLLPRQAFAHRLDEYLEATILSVGSGRVDGAMRLVPGVAVFSKVMAGIDTNGDGTISSAEQLAYAQHVLHDLSLSADGRSLPIHLVSFNYPAIADMKNGIGEIQINFTADLPRGDGHRSLTFENHHQSGIAVYLVNCLEPSDKNIQITAQNRNVNQSFYQVDFTEGIGGTQSSFLPSFSGFAGAFRLGVRHIAEGTDHLLFLLTLLLPAPLIAYAGHWGRRETVGRSLVKILQIVTAFTLGHSLTLMLSAFGLLHFPSRPVEVLIAVSILVSAIHAIRPLLPGREAGIAAFFGLIHGAAFASALSNLGFGHWYRLVSVLGFNLGIEAMQMVVVVAILPSLLIMSRTRAYTPFRIGGAAFAVVASVCWIFERLFNFDTHVDWIVNSIARHAPVIAIALFVTAVACLLLLSSPRDGSTEADRAIEMLIIPRLYEDSGG